MLLLAAAALIMPAIFELVEGKGLPKPGAEIVNYDHTVEMLSALVACVLIASYVAGLLLLAEDPPRAVQPGRRRRARGGPRAVVAAPVDRSRSRSPASPSA